MVVRTESGGDCLPNNCFVNTTVHGHRYGQYSTVGGSYPQLGHLGSIVDDVASSRIVEADCFAQREGCPTVGRPRKRLVFSDQCAGYDEGD